MDMAEMKGAVHSRRNVVNFKHVKLKHKQNVIGKQERNVVAAIMKVSKWPWKDERPYMKNKATYHLINDSKSRCT